jgi:hypothetical protein
MNLKLEEECEEEEEEDMEESDDYGTWMRLMMMRSMIYGDQRTFIRTLNAQLINI